jgi:hypothetical protein
MINNTDHGDDLLAEMVTTKGQVTFCVDLGTSSLSLSMSSKDVYAQPQFCLGIEKSEQQ